MIAASAYAAWQYERVSQLYIAPELRQLSFRNDPLSILGKSWLYSNQKDFAELTTTDLTRANAERVRELALQLVHYSPEAKVVEKLIESTVMLGKNDEALLYLERFRAVFPQDYLRWRSVAVLRPPRANPLPDAQ